MMKRKVIEAFEDESFVVPNNMFTDKVTAYVDIPYYDTATVFLTDSSGSVEVVLEDKETKKIFCKYLFDNMLVFNTYIAQAFAPPDDVTVNVLESVEISHSRSVKISRF